MGKDDRLKDLCRKVGIEDEGLISLLELIHETRKFSKEEIIFKEGDYLTDCNFLMSGTVRVYYINGLGEQVTYDYYTEYGTTLSAGPQRAKACMEAVTDVELICLRLKDIKAIAGEYPELYKIGRKLTEAELARQWEINAALQVYDGKAAYKWFNDRWPEVKNQDKISHIASFLGIWPESLSRLRKNYKDDLVIPDVMYKESASDQA